MVKSKLKLPVKSGGTPDWDFMEAYMQQKEQQLLKPTIEKLCKRLISKKLTNVNGGVILYILTGKSLYLVKNFPLRLLKVA